MRALIALAAAVTAASCSPEPLAPERAEGEGEGEGEGVAGEGEGEGVVVPGEGEGEGDVGEAPTPPPIPPYSHGECPTLTGASTSNEAIVEGFLSSEDTRRFRLLVPPTYDGTVPHAVMFAWHWLNAESGSFVRDGELESAVAEYPFIIVLPDGLTNDNGDKAYQFDWPFVETWGAEKELVFFDDLLSCVNANLNIDPTQVHGIGVSAGGLWVTYLSTTSRANHLASVVSLSGGLGGMPFVGWQMEYAPQDKKFPAVVLWGGESDVLAVNFQNASIAYRDALRADAHFVVECTHDQGHAVPPITPPPGATRFTFLWTFMLDHPYGMRADESPWRTAGLPSSAPSWCSRAP